MASGIVDKPGIVHPANPPPRVLASLDVAFDRDRRIKRVEHVLRESKVLIGISCLAEFKDGAIVDPVALGRIIVEGLVLAVLIQNPRQTHGFHPQVVSSNHGGEILVLLVSLAITIRDLGIDFGILIEAVIHQPEVRLGRIRQINILRVVVAVHCGLIFR